MTFKDFFKRKTDKTQADAEMVKFAQIAKEFVDKNPDTLVILGDPKTDVIFMAYQGVIAPCRLVNKDGSRNAIVANALKHKRGVGDIDRFLLAVDGGLFAIANTLYTIRRGSVVGKVIDWVKGEDHQPPAESKVTLSDGAVLSPIQVVER